MQNIGLNRVITLVRGDTFIYEYKINLKDGADQETEYYTMQEKDHLYFVVMEPNQSFEQGVVRKIYGINDFIDDHINIKLDSDDTWYLNTGKYYYTIKLEKYTHTDDKGEDHYDVFTTQPNTLFFLV